MFTRRRRSSCRDRHVSGRMYTSAVLLGIRMVMQIRQRACRGADSRRHREAQPSWMLSAKAQWFGSNGGGDCSWRSIVKLVRIRRRFRSLVRALAANVSTPMSMRRAKSFCSQPHALTRLGVTLGKKQVSFGERDHVEKLLLCNLQSAEDGSLSADRGKAQASSGADVLRWPGSSHGGASGG